MSYHFTGDAFLPDAASYDGCYYEIIRNAELISSLEVLDSKWNAAMKADLNNISGICHHFLPKVQLQGQALSPDEVSSGTNSAAHSVGFERYPEKL